MSQRRIELLLLFLALAAACFVKRVDSRLTQREWERLREGKRALVRKGLIIGGRDDGWPSASSRAATVVTAAVDDSSTATVAATAAADPSSFPSNSAKSRTASTSGRQGTATTSGVNVRVTIGAGNPASWWRGGKGGGGATKKSTGGSTRGYMKPYKKVPSYAPKAISYGNGPVMSQPIEVYLIWHGTWPLAQKTPVQKFIDSLSDDTLTNKPGSVKDWWSVNRLYKAGATYVTPTVSRSNTEIDIPAASAASGQTPLKKADFLALINFQILSGSLPRLSTGVYVILTSADVDVDGFGNEFCAFHDYAGSVKWMWVGMPERFLSQCTHAAGAGLEYPNGDQVLDGLISNLAHVLSETAVNPNLNSWADSKGNENMDLCEGIWGTEYLTDDTPAVQYNAVGIDDYRFFLPTNLNPATGFCMNGLSVLPGACGKALFGYPCDTGGV